MNDPQAIIDGIRAAIEIPESVTPNKLHHLAQEYADGCAQLNARLEECSRFLRAGNPCEAIRLAEAAPPLLELCNVVDFPDRDDWNRICKSLNLAVAPAMNATVIEQLNDSYNIVYGLESLLREHRCLALARAPLKERLAVLYKLHGQEPENIVWSDMIARFEEARTEEMSRTFEVAKNDKNGTASIIELLREVESSSWLKSPPAELKMELRQWAKREQERRQLVEFRSVADQLQQALDTNNLMQIRHWLEQWKNKIQSTKIDPSAIPGELRSIESLASSRIMRIDQKARQEEKFRKKIQELENTLDETADLDELTECWDSVQRIANETDQQIPERLINAYHATSNAIRKNAYRGRMILLISIAVVGLVVLIVSLLGINSYTKKRRAEAMITPSREYLQRYNQGEGGTELLDQAEAELTKIRQNFSRQVSPSLLAPLEEVLKISRQDDQQRHFKLTRLISQLEKSLKAEKEGTSSLDEELLLQAKELARNSSEITQLEEIEQQHQQYLQSQQSQAEAAIRAKVKSYQAEVQYLAGNLDLTANELSTQLKQILEQVDELGEYTNEFSFVGQQQSTLREAIKKLQRESVHREQLKMHLNELSTKIGLPREYKEALSDLKNNFPHLFNATDLNVVIDEFSSREKIDKWNSFSIDHEQNWKSYANNRDGSLRFGNEFNSLLVDASTIPEIAPLRKGLAFFEPLVNQGGRQELNQDLDRFFNEYREPIWVFHRESAEQNIYYYFRETAGKKVIYRHDKTFPISPLTNDEMSLLKPAPHQVTVADVLTKIQPFLNSNGHDDRLHWYELVESILRDFSPRHRDGMDPLIKLVFIQKILDIVRRDPLMNESFASWSETLNHDLFKREIDWTNYDDTRLTSLRSLAAKTLDELPVMEPLFEALYKRLTEMTRPILAEYHWIGFSWKINDQWTGIISQNDSDLKGTLFIGRIESSGKTFRFVEVGIRENKNNLFTMGQNQLLDGLPLYLRIDRVPQEIGEENN